MYGRPQHPNFYSTAHTQQQFELRYDMQQPPWGATMGAQAPTPVPWRLSPATPPRAVAAPHTSPAAWHTPYRIGTQSTPQPMCGYAATYAAPSPTAPYGAYATHGSMAGIASGYVPYGPPSSAQVPPWHMQNDGGRAHTDVHEQASAALPRAAAAAHAGTPSVGRLVAAPGMAPFGGDASHACAHSLSGAYSAPGCAPSACGCASSWDGTRTSVYSRV